MTARSSGAVSDAGTARWRPAQAKSVPLGSMMAMPRSIPMGPAAVARVSSANAPSRQGGGVPAKPRGSGEGGERPGVCDMPSPPLQPLHLKVLTPEAVRAALARDSRLLVPVGTCEQHGPHLPLGCDTIIVERLADDLSAGFGILRAPTISYGVNTATKRPYPGNATVRRKTLHR